MKVQGLYYRSQVERFITRAKPLEPSKVAPGSIVYVLVEYECKDQSIGKLILPPGNEVLEHKHLNENERYSTVQIVEGIRTLVTEDCYKGESHSLKNTSSEGWAIVNFFKWK